MSAKKNLAAAVFAVAIATTASMANAETRVIVGDTGAPTSVIGRTLIAFKERAETYSNGELKVEILSEQPARGVRRHGDADEDQSR